MESKILAEPDAATRRVLGGDWLEEWRAERRFYREISEKLGLPGLTQELLELGPVPFPDGAIHVAGRAFYNNGNPALCLPGGPEGALPGLCLGATSIPLDAWPRGLPAEEPEGQDSDHPVVRVGEGHRVVLAGEWVPAEKTRFAVYPWEIRDATDRLSDEEFAPWDIQVAFDLELIAQTEALSEEAMPFPALAIRLDMQRPDSGSVEENARLLAAVANEAIAEAVASILGRDVVVVTPEPCGRVWDRTLSGAEVPSAPTAQRRRRTLTTRP